LRTSVEVQPKQKSALTYNSKIIKTIIAAIHDKKGEEVVSMNLKKIPESIADFFIVCEASNPNLLKAIADHVEKQVKEDCDEWPHRMEGKQGDKWILIDYVNVVVHCLLPESRSFYNLEELWQDAEQRQHSA
jgi:ribosome-associated protein